jgi:hypothetical protein
VQYSAFRLFSVLFQLSSVPFAAVFQLFSVLFQIYFLKEQQHLFSLPSAMQFL